MLMCLSTFCYFYLSSYIISIIIVFSYESLTSVSEIFEILVPKYFAIHADFVIISSIFLFLLLNYTQNTSFLLRESLIVWLIRYRISILFTETDTWNASGWKVRPRSAALKLLINLPIWNKTTYIFTCDKNGNSSSRICSDPRTMRVALAHSFANWLLLIIALRSNV